MDKINRSLCEKISKKAGLQYVAFSIDREYRVKFYMGIVEFSVLKDMGFHDELAGVIASEINQRIKHRHPKRKYSVWSVWRQLELDKFIFGID